MAINTLDGRYVKINKSFTHILGFQPEEVIGLTPKDLNISKNPEELAEVMQKLNSHGNVSGHKAIIRTKTGNTRYGEFTADIISISGNKYILTLFDDITERHQMEAEMARLARLDLVGQMAAGIGHEIRNPMTTVRGFLQLLMDKGNYAEDKQYFLLMIEELDRSNSIITEFLSVARNKPADLKMQNINMLIEAILPLIIANAMNMGHDIITEFTDIPNLLLNEKEIRQLILNLVRNGLEAMEYGGVLTIRTFLSEKEVVLSVQDHGKGIAPDALEKLGTPFFTTKENGTGLGLAVCYGIAASHNARIDFETGENGTTFYVRFR